MKKIFRLIAALAATTVAFSCMEEANPETPATDDATGTHYDGPMTTLEFTIDELETKTAWDGENHTWSEGDQIKIIWGTEDDAFTVAEVVDGTVTATVGDVSIYYAVYPATAEHMFSTPEGASEAKFSVRIPRNQDGSFETANLMSAETTKEERSFNFKNLTHIIKFNLNAGHGFDEIEFCANSEDIITGRHFVAITTAEVVIEYNKDGNTNSKYITVNGLESQSGDFYVGLVPDADMSTGIMLRAKKKGEEYKYSAISRTALTTTRSAITKIGNIGNYLRENIWYITVDGTGDGSEDNPGGISKLIELLSKIAFDDGTQTKSVNWRLCNAVINVASGTYNIPEANNSATFEPKGLTKDSNLTIKGEEGTIFTTIEAENVRIFRFNGIAAGKVTFDGITFQGTGETSVSSVGVATYFSGETTGEITYSNCKFTKFNNSNSNSNGAVILANSTENMSLTFSGCEFSENKSTSSGVVALAQAKTTTSFTKCSFISNSVTNYGGAIYQNTGQTTIDNCSFLSNSAKYGGAIANSIGTMTVNNCSFTSNSATDQGGAIITFDAKLASPYAEVSTGKKALLYVYNSSFDQNIAKSQGAAIKAQGSGYLAVVNSTCSGNDCQNNSGGIIRLRNGASKTTGVTGWIINCSSDNPNTTYVDKNGNTQTRTQHSITNQGSQAYCYNSILSSETTAGNDPTTKIFHGTIVGTSLYNIDGTKSETDVIFADQIGAFANGVFPVTASSAAATDGMSSQDLAALGTEGSALMTAMPLFETKYLTVDQKGNSREGKNIMGAYVGE